MKIFWRTLSLMVVLIAFGAVGYYAYTNYIFNQRPHVKSAYLPATENQNAQTNQAQTGPPTPSPLVFESSEVRTLPDSIAHRDWTKNLPVVVIVDKSNTQTIVLQLFDDDSVYKVYQADNAIGKEESPTPKGPYVVASKTLQPTWTPPLTIQNR